MDIPVHLQLTLSAKSHQKQSPGFNGPGDAK